MECPGSSAKPGLVCSLLKVLSISPLWVMTSYHGFGLTELPKHGTNLLSSSHYLDLISSQSWLDLCKVIKGKEVRLKSARQLV